MMAAPLNDIHRSNALTYFALACAVAAIAAAFDADRAPLAAAALGLAAIADTFDGRFARAFRRTPRQMRHGQEIDSLVDAIAFGIAPSVVLFAAAGPGDGWPALVWWSSAWFYAIAAITRLAHFNAEDDHGRFIGIPTPAAALLCATSTLVATSPWLSSATLLAAGIGMIAPVRISRPRGLGLVVFAGWAVAVIALNVLRYWPPDGSF